MRAGTLVFVLVAAALGAPAAAQSPEEQLAAASALFDARKYAESAQRLEAFLAAHGRHARAGAAALALGRCYTELKLFPKAVPAYEKAVASGDTAVVQIARLGLGEAALQTRQYDRAAAALEAAVRAPLRPEQGPLAWYWLGQAQFHLRRYAPAEAAYAKVISSYPRSDLVDAAYYGAGISALRQDRTDAARERLRALVDRFPNSEDRPQAQLVLAQLDLKEKRYQEARLGFETLFRDPAVQNDAPLRDAAEEGLTRALLELEQYSAAAARLESLLTRLPAKDPQRFRAHLSLGHCRYRQKQYAPALSSYLEAARSIEGAAAAEGHYWAANAALALGRPAEAAEQFAKVVSRFPKHELAPRAQLRAGDALTAARQGDAAAAAYRAVIAKYPQAPEAADARRALGDVVASITDPVRLEAALKNAPPAERARGTLRLARLYLAAKKYPQAEAPLAALLKQKPAPDVAAEAHYLTGLAHEAQGRRQPAAASLAAALRLAGAAVWSADAQGRLAWLYLELKQPAAAEKAAAAAVALKPGVEAERQALLAQVQAQLDQQKWDAALEGCSLLLAGTPPPETVATVLFTQAWVSEKRGKPQEALPLWERLAAEHPRSSYAAEALLRIADASFEAEKYDEARAKYAAMLASFPKSSLAPEARFRLGSCLFNLDRHAEAAASFAAVAADRSAGAHVPEALYWTGVALEKAGKKAEAIPPLTRLVTQHPTHARAAAARLRLAALKALVGKSGG